MTELDTRALRRALRPPEEAADPVDVAVIIGRGRLLRRRRRGLAVAGGACVVALVLGSVTAVTHRSGSGPAGPGVRPAVSGRPAPAQPSPDPSPHPSLRASSPPPARPSAVPSPSRAVPRVSPSQNGNRVPTATPVPTPTAIPAAAYPTPRSRGAS